MSLPRISIVTPSYNQAEYVERTVRSVLLQRYANLEYLFLDGGSTDATMRVVEPYRDAFACCVSAKDDGQADAVARGFERSTGEIMAYLNSDDMLAPGALHFVADYFARHPDIDVIYSHRVTVGPDDLCGNYWILPRHSNYLMCRWDLIPQETCFWRRRVFQTCGNVDPSFRFALDYDLFVRYMRGGKWRRVPRFLGAFRHHEAAKTTTQLFSVGQAEIHRVRQTYGMNLRPRHEWLGERYSKWVQRRSVRWAGSGRTLPGSLPGLGWDYNDLWGGLLRDTCMPARCGLRAGVRPGMAKAV